MQLLKSSLAWLRRNAEPTRNVTLILGASGLTAFIALASISTLRLPPTLAAADPWWRNAQEILVPDAVDSDHFGECVALDNDQFLVTAPYARVHGGRSGAVYAFDHPGDTLASKLGIDVAEVSGNFGSSVAICGNIALIGKSGDREGGEDAGAALLYEQDENRSWNHITKLTADDPKAGARFGLCVALDSEFALVGTRTSGYTGAVYVYQRDSCTTWHQCAKLIPAQRAIQECYGNSLAVHKGISVIGAPRDARGSDGYLGTAYIYGYADSTGWKQIAQLTSPSQNLFEQFGCSVAIRDGSILIGAQGVGRNSGAAYLFQQNRQGAWQAVAQLTAPGGTNVPSFGHAVAMSGNTIAIGAPLENASGAVYLFKLDDHGIPRDVGKITLPGNPPDSWFGAALALNGENLLVGAPNATGHSAKSGAAYLFHLASLDQVPLAPSSYLSH